MYKEKEENIVKRDFYITKMLDQEVVNNCCIVYMDKSYICHYHAQQDLSLYDPDDEEDLPLKQNHKEQCYCFIASILCWVY